MRKYSLPIIGFLLILFFSFLYAAKVEIAGTLDSALIYRTSADARGVKYIAPYAAWKNNTGSVVDSVLADTTSMIAAFGSYQKTWIWVVIDTVTVNADSGNVTLRRMSPFAGGYNDTTVKIYKTGDCKIADFLTHLDVVFCPYDSAYVGAQFTIAYVTTQFE